MQMKRPMVCQDRLGTHTQQSAQRSDSNWSFEKTPFCSVLFFLDVWAFCSFLSRRQVRSNVDPNGDYKDDEIWIALGKARLEEKVRGLPGDLDYAGKKQRALFSAVCFTEMIVLSR